MFTVRLLLVRSFEPRGLDLETNMVGHEAYYYFNMLQKQFSALAQMQRNAGKSFVSLTRALKMRLVKTWEFLCEREETISALSDGG